VTFDADDLLVGPRGRHLLLDLAHRLDERMWRIWFDSARHPDDPERRRALATALQHVDVTGLRDRLTSLDLVLPMDDTVSAAMGWQPPRDEDVVAADPAVIEALRPIAEAVAASSAVDWWSSPADPAGLRCTSRFGDGRQASDPKFTGAAEELISWRAKELDDDRRARRTRPDDPAAPWGGHWWSIPAGADLPTTTRPLPSIGSVKLLWEEDGFGQQEALIWEVEPTRAPRIFEIDGPCAWIDLVRRYPLDVSWSRRQDWYRVTGRDGAWLIPDWEAVSHDWDAVHLSVLGYLATATRLLEVGDGSSATLLAGWDPDQSWWLTDILTVSAGPSRWRVAEDAHDPLLEWEQVDRPQ
jgi:hypothetical protein